MTFPGHLFFLLNFIRLALSEVEGLALSEVEGLALSEVEGLTLSEVAKG